MLNADAFAVFDRNFQLVLASHAYAGLVSATTQTLVGESVETVFGPSTRGEAVSSRLLRSMNRVLASARAEELAWVRFPFELERVFRVQVHPLLGTNGQADAVMQVVLEVSTDLAFGALFGADRAQATTMLERWPAVGAVLVGTRYVVEASTPSFDELTRSDDPAIGKSVFELFAPSQIDALLSASDDLMGVASNLEGVDACLEGRGLDGDRTPDVALHLTPIVEGRTTVAVLALGPLKR